MSKEIVWFTEFLGKSSVVFDGESVAVVYFFRSFFGVRLVGCDVVFFRLGLVLRKVSFSFRVIRVRMWM